MAPSDATDDAQAKAAAQASGADRRTEFRAPIELPVEYKRVNSFFADYTKNISRGGTFIATGRPLPIGTEFLFKLSAPGLSAPLELRGAVAWTVSAQQATDEKPAGMGIAFRYRNDDERAAVHAIVEKLVCESLGPVVGKKLLSQTLPGDAPSSTGSDASKASDG